MKLTRVEIAAIASLSLFFGSTLLAGCQPKAPAMPNDAPPAADPAATPQATPTEATSAAVPSAETTAKSEHFQVTGGFRASAGSAPAQQ
jgi:hypothetical protein